MPAMLARPWKGPEGDLERRSGRAAEWGFSIHNHLTLDYPDLSIYRSHWATLFFDEFMVSTYKRLSLIMLNGKSCIE